MKSKIKDFKSLIKSPFFILLIVLFAILIDIISKWCIVINVGNAYEKIYLIPNFLYITKCFNTGAIFGISQDSYGTRVALVVIRAILAVIIPVVYLLKGQGLKMRYKVLIALIYAGCVGNLIDGIFYWRPVTGFDGVVDWIDFDFFNHPFNLADAYVTVSVFLVIIFLLIDEIKEIAKKNKRGEYSMTPEEYEKHLKESKHNENKDSK